MFKREKGNDIGRPISMPKNADLLNTYPNCSML